MRHQYYEFLLDTVAKKLTKLIAWLTSIRALKGSSNGLDYSLIDPGQWDVLEEVPVQVFTVRPSCPSGPHGKSKRLDSCTSST